jgi:hypothetical protein
MNLSQLISSGPLKRPSRVVLQGVEGGGKTLLASQAPDPVILDLEDGSSNYDVKRIPIKGFGEFETALKTLQHDHEGVKTLVIDTVDVLEKFLRAKLCAKYKKDGLEEFPYGKGWQYLLEEFEAILAQLDSFISHGINVIVVAHSTIKRVYLPELTDPFDRYELQIYDRNSARLRQWADAVLFLNWFTKIRKDPSDKVHGTGGRERVIYTTHSFAYDAKNRLNLPEKLECKISELAPLFVFNQHQAPDQQPRKSAQERLAEALAGLHEDWVIDFLRNRKQIAADQTIDDVPSAYCEKALKQINRFRETIRKFGEEHEHVEVTNEQK